MAPKNLNFRMAIPEEFRDTWASFNNQAKIEEITTAELLKDLIEDYLEEFDGDFDKINVESVSDKVDKPKKRMVKKPMPVKKKSFVSKRVSITKTKEQYSDDDETMTIQNTPKFKLLELVRSLDSGDGIDPEELRKAAQEMDIANPRLQLNKMMRRGILYAHLGRIHLT